MKSTDCAGAGNCQAQGSDCGSEIHVAGVLVHARPESLDYVSLTVSGLPNAEVTHQSDDGKLVAVLEARSARDILQQMETIRLCKGVLNVALVYQHAEAEAEMNKEIQE